MLRALEVMANTGVNGAKVWLGDGPNAFTYGLVNIAAFLAQSMKETIKYNVCDENNWDSTSGYAASNACGQLGQSYQDYHCPAGQEHMECEVDPDMVIRATTSATWYGAPPPLFCAPKSLLPESPKWDYGSPWCDPTVSRSYDMNPQEYVTYLLSGEESCRDYPGQKAGGFTFVGGGAPNSPAPNFGRASRTDVEGCCWWGRGVIQTTGVCNIGKLNYFLGKKAADRNGDALYPDVDFCKQPDAICASEDHPELKWIAGFFYWLNDVQTYDNGGWNYINELKKWVDAGMPNPSSDSGFIHAVSGIVNRGCHDPPCGAGDLDGGSDRAQNFYKVLNAMGLLEAGSGGASTSPTTSTPPQDPTTEITTGTAATGGSLDGWCETSWTEYGNGKTAQCVQCASDGSVPCPGGKACWGTTYCQEGVLCGASAECGGEARRRLSGHLNQLRRSLTSKKPLKP